MTTVIHVRDAARVPIGQYIYCGRPTKWGNPHHVGRCPCGKVHSRVEAIQLFREYWHSDAGAMLRVAAITELVDKVLGCWCVPAPCHVQVIAEYVNEYGFRRTIDRMLD